jgi:D-serine deaminase-like pyridoxal phosphate-dependent protein
MPPDPDGEYERLRRAIAGERLPCVVVDLPALDRNLDRCLAPVRAAGKKLRIATKSVRVPDLLRRLLDRAGPTAAGLMTFAAAETAWLRERGFGDLLLAYPTLQADDLGAIARAAAAGGLLRTVIDCEAHLAALASAARAASTTCRAVIEVDVSYRPVGGRLHLGARRSPVRTPVAALALARAARSMPGVAIDGIMAYEAHIAGLPDLNVARRLFKRLAIPAAAALRGEVVAALRAEGLAPALVNAGGTGSLATSAADPAVTEVTAGSGFLAPHLFDRYDSIALEPACWFACPVVRVPDPGHVTCLGGGWIASGAAGADRLPVPALPAGLELTDAEGAGEVQTPLRTARCTRKLAVGDPVFFRHAKAGEVAEHANEVLLVDGDRIVGPARTYRGEGGCWI